ncbi:MAG: hypothetical protein JXR70_19405 [Spirochaetales bacterium]|nr:hypothetical protein [Spirochaetales bacterium]
MVELAENQIAEKPEGLQRKVFCANCMHCKLVRIATETQGKYQLRVKCDAGKWRKKLGEEKLHKYFTVARRSIDLCESYVSMGSEREFLKDLKKTLPIRDEEYTY